MKRKLAVEGSSYLYTFDDSPFSSLKFSNYSGTKIDSPRKL
jgi:hypothetical protein